MKTWAIRIGSLIVIVAVLGFIFREQIFLRLMASQLAPTEAFAAYEPPPAANYTRNSAWAALPDIDDPSDFTPAKFDLDEQATSVPVFFLHPTTFMSKEGWNAPLDNEAAKGLVDGSVLPGQASIFSGCCEVYAPYYRQATLWMGWDTTGSGDLAMELAYTDVSAAFDEFLNRIGEQPFILAGHSQGSQHLENLIANRVSGTPLQGRLIAAYLVGYGINGDAYAEKAPDIPVCQTATDTGCYVTWNTLGRRAKAWPDFVGAVCVNPLSWREDSAAVSAEKNTGSLAMSNGERFERGVSGSECRDDRLLVGEFQSDMFDNPPVNMGPDNHHLLDYALFYASVRKNVSDRTGAYLAALPAIEEAP